MKPQEIVRKSKAMWWADGIPELVTGVTAAVLSLIVYLQNRLAGCRMCTIALTFIMMLVIYIGPRIISSIKSRTSWQKVGYSIPLKSVQWKGVRLIVGLVTLVFATLVIILWPGIWWAFMAAIPFFVFMSVWLQSGLVRFAVYSLIDGLTPILVGRFCTEHCIAIALLLMSLPLLIGGLFTVIKFNKEFGS